VRRRQVIPKSKLTLLDRWVKTPMGQALADAVGFPEPPMEVADSARAVLNLVGT